MSFNIEDHLAADEKVVYRNRFLYVTEEDIEVFNEERTFIRTYINPSVDVFAVGEDKKIWLIKELRPHEKIARWMLPGGGIDEGDTPEGAAQKELQEELLMKAGEMELFHTLNYMGRTMNEKRHFYIGRNLETSSLPDPDCHEILDRAVFSMEELKQMVLDGEFDWSPAAFAILKLAKAVERGEIKL